MAGEKNIEFIIRVAAEIRKEFGVRLCVDTVDMKIVYPEVADTIRQCDSLRTMASIMSDIQEGMWYLQYCQTHKESE